METATLLMEILKKCVSSAAPIARLVKTTVKLVTKTNALGALAVSHSSSWVSLLACKLASKATTRLKSRIISELNFVRVVILLALTVKVLLTLVLSVVRTHSVIARS